MLKDNTENNDPLPESNESNQKGNQMKEGRNESQEEQKCDQEEAQPAIILNIDIGNNQIEQLKIFSIDQPEKDAYEFCFEHQLDYASLLEITKQIRIVFNENGSNSSGVQASEVQFQENNMTRDQTLLKTEGIATETENRNHPPSIVNQTNDNHQTQDQNLHLLSYTENKTQIDPKKLISSEIVVTDRNEFFLLNNPKAKDTQRPSGNKANLIPTGQRQQRNIKADKEASSSSSRLDNIGVQMYQKGLERIRKTNKKVESLRDALNKSDDEIYTFKPHVNTQTPKSKVYRENNKKAYNNPQMILNYKLFNERKRKRLIEEMKERDSNADPQALFTPSINKRSVTIDKCKCNTDKSSSSRFEKLYQDKDKMNSKMQALSKAVRMQFAYCPKLNTANKSIADKQLKTTINSKEEKKKKLLIEIEHHNNYDKETNQKFFHPKLIAKYKSRIEGTNNSKTEVTRFEAMYNFAELYRKRKKNLAAEVNFNETVNTYSSLKTSIDLLNKKKYNSFEKIFKLLDSDEDEMISSKSYSTSKLPQEIIEILKPVFNEFKEDYETLNKVEFIRVCDQLLQYCSREQKNALITFSDSHSKKMGKNTPPLPQQFSFKPSINKNTERIMKRIDKTFDIDMHNLSRTGAIGNSFNNKHNII